MVILFLIMTDCYLMDLAAGVDYQEPVNVILTIPASSATNFTACATVLVIGDELQEDDEMFNIRLETVHENDNLVASSFLVTIVDDGDSEICRPYMTKLNFTVKVHSWH